MVENRSWVQREGVYRWFSSLSSARRAEFLCGLLDLCVPVELRFLGSCLEDLVRRDFHSLRDAEIRANDPADLSALGDVTDEVVRSKLLLSLALLGSDNRAAAGVLYRTLTRVVEAVIGSYGLPLHDGRTAEQFLLLFTMASNHPAFSFHQKQVLRRELGHIHDMLQVSSSSRGGGGEVQDAGLPCTERTAGCYGQHHLHPHHHHNHHQAMSVPLASLSPASCALPDANAAAYLHLAACQPCHAHCSCWHKSQVRDASMGSGPGVAGGPVGRGDRDLVSSPHPDLHPPPHQPPPPLQDEPVPTKSQPGKAGKASIERVTMRAEVMHKLDNASEYVFEAHWSDGSVSSVFRTQQEVTELLSQLSQTFPDEGLEKFLPQSLDLDPRCLTALPVHVLQHGSVHLFCTPSAPLLTPGSLPFPSCSSLPSSSPSSPPTAPMAPAPCTLTPSTKLGCLLQYKGAKRAMYGVATIQPVLSGVHSSFVSCSLPPHLSSLPPPPPPAVPPAPQHSPQVSSLPAQCSVGNSSPACGDPQPAAQNQNLPLSLSISLPQPSALPLHAQPHPHAHPSQAVTTEQNGILDWLRRLRLHKYYPVFKQLTMEEFLALTEEDLNKYDLTQGAKKKLKTQLELQNREMKMEKRYATSQFLGSCSGIAMVTPTSHMGLPPHSTSTAELRVEVDGGPHHNHHQHHPSIPVPRDSGSPYAGSVGSPRAPLCRDGPFVHRRVSCSDPPGGGGGPEKDRSCVVLLGSGSVAGLGRPTAQVLPVQTDPVPSPLPPPCSSHLPFGLPHPPQTSFPQTLLSAASNPARILALPRKPRPQPLCPEDRGKGPLGSGPLGVGQGPPVGLGVRLEKLFPGLSVDGPPPPHPSGPQDPQLVCLGAAGLMVDTSSALTSTSNSLHHVSHPPLHFHLSSSPSPSPSAYYTSPPSGSTSSACYGSFSSASAKSAVSAAFLPAVGNMVAPPGASYCSPTLASSPSPSPPSSSSTSSSPSDQVSSPSALAATVCGCSSCSCWGGCGGFRGPLPGYAAAGFLQPFSAGPSLFTLGPLLHLSPLIAASSTPAASATPFSYPLVAPPPLYRHSPASHDPQQGFGLYPAAEGGAGHGGHKQTVGNLSCYNCGASGHRAEDCKQPPMDPHGAFRLKYTPHSDSKDSGE